jgi:hypothetical protein
MQRHLMFITAGLLLSAGMARAGGPPWTPGCAPPPCATPSPYTSSTTAPGTAPSVPGLLDGTGQQGAQQQQPQGSDAFAQAPPAGGETAASALPNLIGDQNSFIIFSRSATRSSRSGVAAALAQVGRGAFKITENESPAPQDRLFVTYNYFYNVNKTFNPGGVNIDRTNVQREEVGFEKTFLGGDASFGMRLPILEIQGEDVDKSNIGDLSLIFKYAFFNNRETGNLLSGGMVLTVPTGPAFLPSDTPDIHSTLFQPFVGGIWRSGDLYVHGFTSLLVPTDSRDVMFIFNDYGIGYFIYQNNSGGMISSISPTVEAHINTPLNHRGSQVDPLGGIDVFDMTAGVNLGFGSRAYLTIGVNTPLSGPKPYDLEAVAQLNWRF